MRLEDLNWMDVQRYLKHDDRIVLITGATEQHGYLSLLSDVKIPQAIADAAALREKVLVAPPLNFGCSPDFVAFPGTMSLRAETFARALTELIECLANQGFRRFLVLNGHGGNAVYTVLAELAGRRPELRLACHNWYRLPRVEAIVEQAGLPAHHANWSENFAFTRVAEVPEDDKPPVEMPSVLRADEAREVLGDGSFGGPYQADDEFLDRIFQAAVQDTVEVLRKL